ncbi:hypothetical protein [Phaeodactylibacter luteus]|uniref:Uncharacterized protein n=1 Tax=Phaeodactylibacter luteus TaxID=1564516 RepID=A0A5C6S439_9BACT|nr:hypothetical protein [Phaeodactylibacter luteus]TXB68312.1 hypothetical protein FRY97_02730 [Phaeodactylibacter luteus]
MRILISMLGLCTLVFTVAPVKGQDTLRASQLLDLLDRSAGKGNTEKQAPEKSVAPSTRPSKGLGSPDDSGAYFGQFKTLVEQALFSNLLIMEQEYIVEDEEGDDVVLQERAGVPILSVGLVVGNKVLSAMSTVRPWAEDARLAQVGGWGNRRFGNLRYRQLEEGARWGDAKTYAIDSIDGQFSLYSGLRFNSRLEAVPGEEVAEGILMLIGYDKGVDPAGAKWYTDFTSASPDWDKGEAPVQIPEQGKVYIGGFFLYPDISPGSVSFRVAGVLEISGQGTTLKAVTEPKLLNDADAIKKSSRTEEENKKTKKKSRKRRSRRG